MKNKQQKLFLYSLAVVRVCTRLLVMSCAYRVVLPCQHSRVTQLNQALLMDIDVVKVYHAPTEISLPWDIPEIQVGVSSRINIYLVNTTP